MFSNSGAKVDLLYLVSCSCLITDLLSSSGFPTISLPVELSLLSSSLGVAVGIELLIRRLLHAKNTIPAITAILPITPTLAAIATVLLLPEELCGGGLALTEVLVAFEVTLVASAVDDELVGLVEVGSGLALGIREVGIASRIPRQLYCPVIRPTA